MTQFKVGDRVRVCTKEHGDYQFGLVGVISDDNYHGYSNFRYRVVFDKPDKNGTKQNVYRLGELELVQPVGPVVTETRSRIVPGTYDGVTVWENPRGKIEINFHLGDPAPDELDAAAAVLSALAKGLRDVD